MTKEHERQRSQVPGECVFSRGWGKRDWVDQDPDYDCLRDDPRFKLLLAKLK